MMKKSFFTLKHTILFCLVLLMPNISFACYTYDNQVWLDCFHDGTGGFEVSANPVLTVKKGTKIFNFNGVKNIKFAYFNKESTGGSMFTQGGNIIMGRRECADECVMLEGAGNIYMEGGKITGVADGKADKDAVNVSQLRAVYNALKGGTGTGKTAYLEHQLTKTTKELRAGIAGAVAMAGLPSSQLAGKGMFSASVGGYNGQNAVAVGYSRNSENNRYSIKLNTSLNTVKDISYSAGIGVYF